MADTSKQAPPGPHDVDSHAETAPPGVGYDSDILMPPAHRQTEERSGTPAAHDEHGDASDLKIENQRDKHWPIPKR